MLTIAALNDPDAATPKKGMFLANLQLELGKWGRPQTGSHGFNRILLFPAPVGARLAPLKHMISRDFDWTLTGF